MVARRQVGRIRRSEPGSAAADGRRSGRIVAAEPRERSEPQLPHDRKLLTRLEPSHVRRRRRPPTPQGRGGPPRRNRAARPARSCGCLAGQVVSGRQCARPHGAGMEPAAARLCRRRRWLECPCAGTRLRDEPGLVAARGLDRLHPAEADPEERGVRADDRASKRDAAAARSSHWVVGRHVACGRSPRAHARLGRVPALGRHRDRRLHAGREAPDESLSDRRNCPIGRHSRDAAPRSDRRARRRRQNRRWERR
jgi:hypothetical protein